LALLAGRKSFRTYPVFTFYIFTNLISGALAFAIYRQLGFFSRSSLFIAWGLQTFVVCARALAVVEVCKRILARYRGIWRLARRVLLGCAALILLYSLVAARHQWRLALPSADRAVSLSITAVIVVVLLFVRHYDVEINLVDRSLAVGFCLYACFRALNDTILDNYVHKYWPIWNLMEMLAFLASLLVWAWALRKTQTETRSEQTLLPARIYEAVVPQINDRLRLLNDRLRHFSDGEHAEEDKP
jgi:hypothetical protein